MGKLKYLVLHCTATPEGREVTADEIRRLMVHAVDVLDEDNFRSLLCSLIGHRDYSELEARMIEGNTAGGGEVRAQIPGGYAPLLKESGDISCPRFLEENLQGGRQRSADEADSVR